MAKFVSLTKLQKFKEKIDELIDAKIKTAMSTVAGGDIGNTVTFNADGSISTSYVNGKSEKTVFNSDGSITITTKDANGKITKVETTRFNSDGTIATTITEGSGN